MEHPVFQNRFSLIFYILVWTIISGVLAYAVFPFSGNSLTESLVWGSTAGFLFGIISLPLWNILKYSDYLAQRRWQSIINYIALGLLTVGVWIGATYFIVGFILVPEVKDSWLISLIPFQTLIGSCFFVITVLVCNNILKVENEIQTEDELDKIDAETIDNEPISEQVEIIEQIAIKVRQKIEVVMVPDIIFIQSEGDYTMIHTANSHFLKEQTMKYFGEHLPPNQFVRIHRSYIVNVHAISKIELFEKQTHLLTMKNGLQIKASLAGYKLLKSVLKL